MRTTPTQSVALELSDLDALLTSRARHIAEGSLFIPTPRRPVADEFLLSFIVDGHSFDGQRARVVQRPMPPRSPVGFWAQIEPGPALSKLIDLHARKRKAAPSPLRLVRPGNSRAFDTVLEVAFENLPSLAAQYASDISRGGLFIRCETQPAMRSRVELRLTLPNAQTIRLDAEVVHCAPTGVGVQFSDPHQLGPIISLLEAYRQRRPKVLVVDDEAIWRSTLARALTRLGVDVQLASDGREGLNKLIDGFFELDLAIIDLHMPNIDGRGLIERVRNNGGESALKLFLFSAASRDELDSLAAPGLATAVFSKLDSFDQLIARIASELPGPTPSTPSLELASAA